MHDPLLVTGRGGIPLRMAQAGAPARSPATRREELERLGVPVLGTLEAPAIADGGDRFWLDTTTMAIGLGYRTNRAGADAVARLVEPEGIAVEAYDMPHDQGPGMVLHLQSFLSAVSDELVRRLRAARARPAAAGPARARLRLDRDRRTTTTSRWAATCSASGPAWS